MIMRLSVGTGAYLVGDEVAGVHEVAGAQAGGRAACDFRPQQIPHRYVHQLVLRAWTKFTVSCWACRGMPRQCRSYGWWVTHEMALACASACGHV